jgi:hypothetical protein
MPDEFIDSCVGIRSQLRCIRFWLTVERKVCVSRRACIDGRTKARSHFTKRSAER